MLTQSHAYMAKQISKNLGENFNHNYFYLGSMAPDFILHHKKRKHEYRYSFSYILQEIDKVDKIEDINLISYNLGIINHYLTDFFCKAHNCTKLLNNMWEHFRYETLLHKVLISCINEITLNKDICNVEEYIKENYERYLDQNPSVVIDILYSLEICQSVSYYILRRVNLNTLKETA